MSQSYDGSSNFDHQQQVVGLSEILKKGVENLESEVRRKDQRIKELEDELKTYKPSGLSSQNGPFWKEVKEGLEKVINDYLSKAFSQSSHISQPLESIEANQTFPTTAEPEDHVASSSTSVSHTSGHLGFQYTPSHISNHPNHESTDSEFSRSNDYHNSYEEYSNDSKQVPMHMPLPIQPSPPRRFPNGINGTNNNNYHNNNNNNRNNNNNNNNNRKKNTVFVAWTGKMERNDLETLFDRADVAEIRISQTKPFAHFDFKTNEAMKKALTYDKRVYTEYGTLRVEAGKPRSNNNTENNNNNNNNNGQRPQNKNYNRLQNKQSGGINGYQKLYNNKYPQNGINGFSNNHNNIDDSNDTPILSQGMQIPSNDMNL